MRPALQPSSRILPTRCPNVENVPRVVVELASQRAPITPTWLESGRGVVFHDCRRLFSTPARRAAVGRETVKDLGGWSSIAVVERQNTGETQPALEHAMDRIVKTQGMA